MAAPAMNNPATMADDPKLVLPSAVRAAAARADALHAELLGGGSEQVPAPEPEQDQTQQTSAPAGTPDGVAPQEVQVAPAPAPSLAPAAPAEDDDTWEKRYRASQGRLSKATQDIRELSNAKAQLEALLAALQSAPAVAPAPAELPAEFVLSPDDQESYGEDLLRVISARAGQVAQSMTASMENRLMARLAQIEGGLAKVGTVVQQDTTEKFKVELTRALPNWQQINVDPNFISWLGLTDPFSGSIRMDMLRKAYAEGNAPRTLAFFKGFLQEEAATAPVASEHNPGTTIVPKVDLQSLAAPGRAKTVSAPAGPTEKPIILRADIAKFYSDCAAGKYNGRDAEKKAREVEIFKAQNEGRIR